MCILGFRRITFCRFKTTSSFQWMCFMVSCQNTQCSLFSFTKPTIFLLQHNKSLVFYGCNMFRQYCAIFREFLHQVLKQMFKRRTSAAQEERIKRAGNAIRNKKFREEHIIWRGSNSFSCVRNLSLSVVITVTIVVKAGRFGCRFSDNSFTEEYF